MICEQMRKQLEIHFSEIDRLKEACEKTKSEKLKRDYTKKIKEMEKEAETYVYLWGKK